MSVGEKVYSTLRRRLMSGYYEPGSKLKEEVVAADLSVSRTPVRAAIHRLIAEGLLEPAPKRGALVTPWGAQDVEDIFNLRIMLEGYGASLAAKNATREEVDRLEALNEKIAAAVDSEREDRLLDWWWSATCNPPKLDYPVEPGFGIYYSGPGTSRRRTDERI